MAYMLKIKAQRKKNQKAERQDEKTVLQTATNNHKPARVHAPPKYVVRMIVRIGVCAKKNCIESG